MHHAYFLPLPQRTLIWQFVRRDVLVRYRGSLLGLGWSILTPLLMLAVYTFVFRVIFKARWTDGANGDFEFALQVYAGLIVYTLFAEVVNRIADTLSSSERLLGENIQSLQAVNRELRDTQEILVQSEKLATIGRLSAGVAHEIGNPLGAILGYLDMLKHRPGLDDDTRDWLFRMENEGRRVTRTQFERNLAEKIEDEVFLSDVQPLLALDVSFDPPVALERVRNAFISRLPEGSSRKKQRRRQ